jgi:hypothetical protein
MTYRRYHGSCHCQAVQYEAEFDLAAGSNRCNCSLCSKARAWFLFVRGDKFKLLAGDDVLSTYQWVPPGRAESGLTYRFCSRCGIRLYATGELAQLGGRTGRCPVDVRGRTKKAGSKVSSGSTVPVRSL